MNESQFTKVDLAMVGIDFDEVSLDSYAGVEIRIDGVQYCLMMSDDPESDFASAVNYAHQRAHEVMLSSSVDTFVMCKDSDQYVWGYNDDGYITRNRSQWRLG